MNIFRTLIWAVGLIISMFIIIYNFIFHYNTRATRYVVYMIIGIVIAIMFILAILFEVAGV